MRARHSPHVRVHHVHALLPPQAQRYVSQLKGQVNALEAELEEQRKQKQKALVDNEQLRHELAQLRAAQLEGERNQGLREEAESAWPGRVAEPSGRVWSPVGASAELGVTASPLTAEKASVTEARYTKLKEQHSKLIATHAELLRKVGPVCRQRAGGGRPGGGRA